MHRWMSQISNVIFIWLSTSKKTYKGSRKYNCYYDRWVGYLTNIVILIYVFRESLCRSKKILMEILYNKVFTVV